ncbi:hypothetical protein BH23ACT12_BH23ACT12_22440 [soil metagenome]
MAHDEIDESMLEGVGNSAARQKTLGEQPVSDQDIAEIHQEIADLNKDLARLRAEGEATFGKKSD